MAADPGLLAALLTAASLASLSVLALMCLRCKRKPKTIHEDHQVYHPQTFQRGGSKFAVMKSKKVTGTFPHNSTTVETLEDYQKPRVPSGRSGSPDDDYISPIEHPVYENEKRRGENPENPLESPGVYGNIFPSDGASAQKADLKSLNLLSGQTDDDDYENSDFLKNHEDSEPDYVNQEVDPTCH